LTGLTFQPVALAWMFGLYLLSALGCVLCLRVLGWTAWLVPTALFLLLPQVVTGAFYGNVIGVVFAGIGGALAIARRHPLPAGALLAVAWLKPPVALPLALLIVLFHTGSRRATAAGFGIASLALLAVTLVTTGAGSLGIWVSGLLRYSRDMAIQPDVASLAGLYVRWAPTGVRLGVEALVLLAALALTALVWRLHRAKQMVPVAAVAWLWFVWFLATPYAHFFDEMLLTVAFLTLLGFNGRDLVRPMPALSLYLLFFSLLLISWTPYHAYLLALPLLVIAALLYVSGGRAVPRAA
jgi:hypothetical protein